MYIDFNDVLYDDAILHLAPTTRPKGRMYNIYINIYTSIYIKTEKHLKMNREVRMLLPKKDLIQVEYIGKINNYYEDIYIPPYNNTD